MIKFEKKFLYTFADEKEVRELIGKKGIFFDEPICDYDLENKPLHVLTRFSPESPTPFEFEVKGEYGDTDGCDSTFFYYDSNLEVKRAYVKGKTIQVKMPHSNKWINFMDGEEPSWNDCFEYRIKPETKEETETCLTNRQVAEWLAKGNGEILLENVKIAISYYSYDSGSEDVICKRLIRKWGDTKWHIATKEYIEGEKI